MSELTGNMVTNSSFPGIGDSNNSLNKFLLAFDSTEMDDCLLTKSGESSFDPSGLSDILDDYENPDFTLLNNHPNHNSPNVDTNTNKYLNVTDQTGFSVPVSPHSDVGAMEVPHTPENMTDSENESKYDPIDEWRPYVHQPPQRTAHNLHLPVVPSKSGSISPSPPSSRRTTETSKRKYSEDDDTCSEGYASRLSSDDNMELKSGGDLKRRNKFLPPGIILPTMHAKDFKITAVFFKLQDSQGKADTKQSGTFKSTTNVQHFIRSARQLIKGFPKSQPARIALIGDQGANATTNGHPNLIVTWASQNNKYGKPYKDGKVAVWTVGTDKFPPKEYAFIRLDGTEFADTERRATAAPCYDETNPYATHAIANNQMIYIGPLCICGEFLAKSLGGKYCGECDGKYRNFHTLLDKFSSEDRHQHVSDVLNCFSAEEKARHLREFLMNNPDVSALVLGGSKASNTESQVSHGSILLEFESTVDLAGGAMAANSQTNLAEILLEVVKDYFSKSQYGLKYAKVNELDTTSSSLPSSSSSVKCFEFKLCFDQIDGRHADFESNLDVATIKSLNDSELVSRWMNEARVRAITAPTAVNADSVVALAAYLNEDQQRKLWLHLVEAASETASPTYAPFKYTANTDTSEADVEEQTSSNTEAANEIVTDSEPSQRVPESMTPTSVNGCWSLFSTTVTITNSQFVASKCSGGHYDHCRYHVSEVLDGNTLKVMGGPDSKWESDHYQLWTVRDSDGAIEVRNNTDARVTRMWEPTTPPPTYNITGSTMLLITTDGKRLKYNRQPSGGKLNKKTPFGYAFEGHFNLHQKVVVKEIDVAKVNALGFQQFFDAKIAMQLQLDCKHIVRMVLSASVEIQSSPKRLMAMEYCNGGDLANHLSQVGTMDDADLINISTDVATALSYLASFNAMHGDLKEASILLHQELGDDRAIYKLSDVGQSRYATNAMYGSPCTFAPEVTHRDVAMPIGVEADLWSFGTVLFKCITGSDLIGHSASTSTSSTNMLVMMGEWQWEDTMLDSIDCATLRISKGLKSVMTAVLARMLHRNSSHRLMVDRTAVPIYACMDNMVNAMRAVAVTTPTSLEQQQSRPLKKHAPEPGDSAIGSSIVSNFGSTTDSTQGSHVQSQSSALREKTVLVASYQELLKDQEDNLNTQTVIISEQQQQITELNESLDTSKHAHLRKSNEIKDLKNQVAKLKADVIRLSSANVASSQQLTNLEGVTRMYENEGSQELINAKKRLDTLPADLATNLVNGRANVDDFVVLERAADQSWLVVNNRNVKLSDEFQLGEILQDANTKHAVGKVFMKNDNNTIMVEAIGALRLDSAVGVGVGVGVTNGPYLPAANTQGQPPPRPPYPTQRH